MNIQLACMSLMWGYDMPAEAMAGWLDDVKAAGYPGVATFDHCLHRFIDEADFPDRLRDTGLELVSLDVLVGRDFDGLRRTCERFADLGGRHLVAIAGLARKGEPIGMIADLLNDMARVAGEFDLPLGYHNHTGNTGETYMETSTLLRATDPDLVEGFVDLGHATKDFNEHPPAERAIRFLREHADRIGFIEFKDWHPQTQLGTVVGEGLCDWDAVFQWLADTGYQGWITIEQNAPSGDRSARQCAEASRRFVEQQSTRFSARA